MEDHLVLYVDCLITSPLSALPKEGSDSNRCNIEENVIGHDDEEPLVQMFECRICLEEDYVTCLETPCACSGSLKHAHRACVQRWCDEKGDIACEICHEPYKPDYTAPARPQPDETPVDIPVFDTAAVQRHFLEAEYEEHVARNAVGTALCGSTALILMAFLLLRRVLTVSNGDGDDGNASTYFSLFFLLRAAGFLLACCIMDWTIGVLQGYRQRQEAAAPAETEAVFILQSEEGESLQVTIAPGWPWTPRREPNQ